MRVSHVKVGNTTVCKNTWQDRAFWTASEFKAPTPRERKSKNTVTSNEMRDRSAFFEPHRSPKRPSINVCKTRGGIGDKCCFVAKTSRHYPNAVQKATRFSCVLLVQCGQKSARVGEKNLLLL